MLSIKKQKKINFKKAASCALAATVIFGQLTPFHVLAAKKNTTVKSTSGAKRSLYTTAVYDWQGLYKALRDKSVTDITLGANIKLAGSVAALGSSKRIYGNGYTIDANYRHIRLVGANTTAAVENVKIINTDAYGILWNDGANAFVSYKNVTHQGKQLIYLPYGTLSLSGKVTSKISGPCAQEGFQGHNLTLMPGADVSFTSLETRAEGLSPVTLMGANSSLNINTGARLSIRSKVTGIYSAVKSTLTSNGELDVHSSEWRGVRLYTGSTMEFKGNSKTKVVTASPWDEEALEATSGSIYVRSGATFEAESRGRQGTIITGGNLVFERGSNFLVRNRSALGGVFGTYAKPSHVSIASDEGIQTWLSGATGGPDHPGEIKTNYADSLSATFDLSGYLQTALQTNFTSNNAKFKSNFKAGLTGKITGGSFADIPLDLTTINALNTKSTVVTGKASANADVEIKAITGDQGNRIGTGKADGNGNYSITIPKQAYGTTVTAQATRNGKTSNIASTTVEQADLAETTINELTMYSEKVKGKAEPNAEVVIKAGTKEIGRGKANAEGVYSIAIKEQAAGTEVTAQATLNGKTSNVAKTTVIAVSTGSIVPIEYGTGESFITGTFMGDVVSCKLIINGEQVSEGGTFSSGTFNYPVDPTLIKASDDVKLVPVGEDGYEGKAVKVEVLEGSDPVLR